MAFCAIFVPDFLLQAVERLEPVLRNGGLIVLEAPAPTFRVIAINAIAKALGVRLGMTKAAAAAFGGAEMRLCSKEQEETAHAALLDAAWSFSPRVENTALDTVLLDLAGLTTLFGSYENVALQIKSRCSSLGFHVHVAVSENAETAKILACARPGPTIVPLEHEAQFIAGLPVGLLRPSEELARIFQQWGVSSCGALAALPVLSLSECLGQEGVRLHTMASGKGNRALIIAEPTHLFEESLELDDPIEDLEPLSFLLGRLLDQLCVRLSARVLAVRTIQLQFELQPGFEKAFDSSRECLRTKQSPETFYCTLALPKPVQDPKLLLKLLRLRLQATPPKAPVQKIQMRAEPDRPRAMQCGLFLPAMPDPEKLELTIARIADIVGENNVGSPELLDCHRPDAFRMQRFLASSPAVSELKETEDLKIGFRVIRPRVKVSVDFQRGNRPTFGSRKRAGRLYTHPVPGAAPVSGGKNAIGKKTHGIWKFVLPARSR